MSVSNVSDINSLTDGKSAQSTSGNTQVVSLSGGVSTMGSSGGITCYKAACSSGYYLDEPNSTYFTSTSTTGTIVITMDISVQNVHILARLDIQQVQLLHRVEPDIHSNQLLPQLKVAAQPKLVVDA